jgi:UDP-glucuronate 4-epimerase
MRVLVTGVAGFIGSSLAEGLIARGDTVVGVDNFNTFYDPAIKEGNVREIEAKSAPSSFRLVRADILKDERALNAVFENDATRPDVICHLAAWAGVRPSILDPLTYQANNVEGTLRLLELARKYRVRPFVFASSSSVYGSRRKVPFSEDDRVDDPVSPYAATKKAGELIGYTYHAIHDIRFIGLRFFTVYGPRQRPEMAIHLFARRIFEDRPITLNGDGTSSRDYTYIDDCTKGVMAAIDRAHATDGYRIYNLGCSDTTKLIDLVRMLERALDKKAKIETVDDQPGDVPLTYADIARAKSELGYDPKTRIQDGIPKFVSWFLRRAAAKTA